MDLPPSASTTIPRLWPFKRTFYGWAIVYTSFLVSFAQVPMYGPVFAVFVKPIGDDLGWSRSTITLAFTIGSLGGSMLSAVVGSLVDRYGARGVIVVAGMVVGSALLGVAAMTEPWHFWLAYGAGRAAAVAGIGLGTSVSIANWFVVKRGRAAAIRGMGQRLGQSVMPLLILPVLVLIGWREAFLLLGLVAVVFISLPAGLFLRRRPEDMGFLPDGVIPGQAHDAAQAAPGRAETEYSWTLDQARRTRTLWVLTMGMALGLAAQIAVNVHVVASFEDQGMSEVLAVTVVTIFGGVSAVSMLAWGFLAERLHVRLVAMICMALYAVSMLVLLAAGVSYVVAVLFAVLFGLATGGWTIAQVLMVANYFGRRHAGSIRGFVAPIEGLVAISGPLVAAVIRDTTGTYDSAYWAATVVFGASFAAFLLARPPAVPVSPQHSGEHDSGAQEDSG